MRAGGSLSSDDNLPFLCWSADGGGLHPTWTTENVDYWREESPGCEDLPRELLRSGGAGTGREGRGGVLSTLGYFLY